MNRPTLIMEDGRKCLRHGRFAFPSDEPGMLHFYLEELLVPRSPKEMALAVLARRFPAFARAGFSRTPAERWKDEPALADLLRSAGLRFEGPLRRIQLADYAQSDRGKSISFLFQSGGSRPLAMAKSSSLPGEQQRLAQEQAALRQLGTILPQSLRTSIPVPLGDSRSGPAAQFVETFSPGSFLYRDLRRSFRPRLIADRHFRIAGDWLLAFQQATVSGEVVLDDASIRQHLLAPFEALELRDGMSAAVTKLASEIARRAAQLPGQRFPLVARHGDYWARNILVDASSVRVIDWDGYEAASPPFHDLLHFALSYGLSFPWRLGRWDEPVQAFHATLRQSSQLRPLIRRELMRAAQGLGISPALASLFVPVTIAERALMAPGDTRWLLMLEECARKPSLFESLARE
jgi:hypothetical protein